jgi:hypothetical protein
MMPTVESVELPEAARVNEEPREMLTYEPEIGWTVPRYAKDSKGGVDGACTALTGRRRSKGRGKQDERDKKQRRRGGE